MAVTKERFANWKAAYALIKNKLDLVIGSHGNRGDQWGIEYDLSGAPTSPGEEPSAAAGGRSPSRSRISTL